jgi:hypothetical protein
MDLLMFSPMGSRERGFTLFFCFAMVLDYKQYRFIEGKST